LLSRLAEALFWIGRYVERAEDTARLLDVQLHLLLEDSPYDEQDVCHALLAAMGLPDVGGELDARRLVELLAYDHTSPTAITGALSAARENARGAREVISSEIWECLNVTHHGLPRAREHARGLGPHTFFRYVKERTAIFSGLTDSTMSRDDGWLFLVLGRSLERVDMTARLLSVGPAGQNAGPWLTVLRCCGAAEAYLRTYRGRVDTEPAVEFLLLDRLFPRSVYHALATAERCLRELDPSGSTRAGLDNEALLRLGRIRTDLEFQRARDMLTDLPRRLADIELTCQIVGGAVASRYFEHTRAVAWASEGNS
jgi:uncharacterized alpha-E superfamily protein